MKIRHILPADGLVALYALPVPPFYRVIPCTDKALVQRRYFDSDGVAVSVDEIVGLITQGGFVAADNPLDGSVFVTYSHPGRYTDEELSSLLQYAYRYGVSLYDDPLALTEGTDDGTTSSDEAPPSPSGERDPEHA